MCHSEEKKTDKQYHQMIETPIPKLITSLAIPTIISMLITSVYNIADTYFVSKLGRSASGAIGIVFSLMAAIQAIGFTVGMGAGSTISRLLGEQKEQEAKEIAVSGFALSLALGAIVTGIGLLYLTPLMRLLGASETILPYAKSYGFYILLAAPVMSGSFVLNNLLRSEGKAKFAMLGMVAGAVFNLVLDPIFIFDLDLGITGAALATAISQSVGFVILLGCFLLKKSSLPMTIRNISRKAGSYGAILKTGFPSFLRQGLASVATVLLNQKAADYGDSAVAAMSIVGKIFMVFFCIVIGFGQGYQPALGYNYGAREWKRVRKAAYFTTLVAVGIMSVLGVAGFLCAGILMKLFMQADEEVVAIGTFALRCQCVVMPLIPIGVVSNMTFQSIGREWSATFLSACRQGVFFLPLILLLPGIWGLTGVQITQAVADAATAVVSVPFIVVFFRKLKKLEHAEN